MRVEDRQVGLDLPGVGCGDGRVAVPGVAARAELAQPADAERQQQTAGLPALCKHVRPDALEACVEHRRVDAVARELAADSRRGDDLADHGGFPGCGVHRGQAGEGRPELDTPLGEHLPNLVSAQGVRVGFEQAGDVVA